MIGLAEQEVMPPKKSQKRPTRRPKGRRAVAVTLKGSEEWKAWLERGAAFCRTDVSKVIDIAVAHYLKAQGFEEKPPER